jgi:hypothetical protein
VRGYIGMSQMSVEEILITYLPLEEDARELVDLYYRVSLSNFLDMGSSSACFFPPLPLSLHTLGEKG